MTLEPHVQIGEESVGPTANQATPPSGTMGTAGSHTPRSLDGDDVPPDDELPVSGVSELGAGAEVQSPDGGFDDPKSLEEGPSDACARPDAAVLVFECAALTPVVR